LGDFTPKFRDTSFGPPKGTSFSGTTRFELSLVQIGRTVRPVALAKNPKKKKRQWQTGYSPRPPTSPYQSQILHAGWPPVCSSIYQVLLKLISGFEAVGGQKSPFPITLAIGVMTVVVRKINLSKITPENRNQSGPTLVHVHRSGGGGQRSVNFGRDRPSGSEIGTRANPAQPGFCRQNEMTSSTSQWPIFTKFGNPCPSKCVGNNFRKISLYGSFATKNLEIKGGQTNILLRPCSLRPCTRDRNVYYSKRKIN